MSWIERDQIEEKNPIKIRQFEENDTINDKWIELIARQVIGEIVVWDWTSTYEKVCDDAVQIITKKVNEGGKSFTIWFRHPYGNKNNVDITPDVDLTELAFKYSMVDHLMPTQAGLMSAGYALDYYRTIEGGKAYIVSPINWKRLIHNTWKDRKIDNPNYIPATKEIMQNKYGWATFNILSM